MSLGDPGFAALSSFGLGERTGHRGSVSFDGIGYCSFQDGDLLVSFFLLGSSSFRLPESTVHVYSGRSRWNLLTLNLERVLSEQSDKLISPQATNH